jgi:cobalamin-dependent methionine synthase I
MAILRPLLIENGVLTAGTLVIGTVQGDLHDIGKNIFRANPSSDCCTIPPNPDWWAPLN